MKLNRFFLIIIVALVSNIHLHGQNQKLDSLWNIYKNAAHDTTRIQSLQQIGDAYYYENLDTALFYYNKAFDLALENNPDSKVDDNENLNSKYAAFQAVLLKYIGFAYKDQGSCDNAIEYHLRSSKIYQELGDKKGMAGCYSNIGIVYAYQGSYDKAIEYYLKALKIFEELGYKKGMSACYTNIGIVYYNQENFDKAIDYYQRSFKIEEELGNKNAMAGCCINIGIIYGEKLNYDKSIEYFQNSLEIFKELGDLYGISQCYNNIGSAYQLKGSYEKAIDCLLKSLKIKEEIGDKQGMVSCYINIARLNIALADSTAPPKNIRFKYLNKAIEFGTKAILLAKEISAVPLENEAAFRLMSAYNKLGNFKKAMEYADIYITTRDSLFKEEKTKSIADAEAKFKSEKKQLEIDKLSKEKELQRSEILRQRLIIVFVILGLILIASFAVFVVNRWRITRRQKEKIRIQRDEIEKQRDLVTDQKDRIEKQKQQITHSINYARRIQKAVLLSGENADNILGEHFILYKPKDIVSGDFYWATRINEWLIAAVADCTGHGVPGAFMSMLGVSFLNEIVRKKEVIRASEVLDHLRDSVIEALQQKSSNSEQKDGLDIAFCVLNTKTNMLQFAGAFNPLYIVTAQKELKVILPDKQPVAIYEHMKPFTNNELQLHAGDCLYLISDGFEDQFGGTDDKKFMIKYLKELLLSISGKPMPEQQEILNQAFTDWKGKNEQTDDVTLLGLKIQEITI